MKPAKLPSHTRICRAALRNACESLTTAQKITSAQTSHLNIIPPWQRSEKQLLFPRNKRISGGQGGKQGACIPRKYWREVSDDTVHPGLTECCLHNLPYAKSSCETPAAHPLIPALVHITPEPQLETLDSAFKAYAKPQELSAPIPSRSIHVNKSEIPGTAFSLVHLAPHSPRTIPAAASARLSLSRGRRGQEEMKLRSNNVCSSTLPSPFVFANPKDLLGLSRESLKVSNVFFPVSDVLDNS